MASYLRVLLLIWLMFISVCSQSPVFLVHPVSIAAIDGSTREFTCSASNSITIVYFVNNTAATNATIMAKGFTQLGASIVDGVTSETLSVSVSSLYNNTDIFCRAIGSSNNVDSNTAILTVQGELSSVVDLSSSSTNGRISWSPPFTLPGTEIIGYNISVTSNSTTTNYFTMDSYYVLNEMDSSVCVVNVTVSGYNGLNGESNSTLAVTTQLTVCIDAKPDKDLSLSVFVDISKDCSGYYNNFTISLLSADLVIDSADVTPSGALVNSTDVFTVSEDLYYTIDVSFEVLADEINNLTNLSTFGVELVDINSTSSSSSGTVAITCVFRSFSTDDSCIVQLQSTKMPSSVEYSATFNRTNDNIAEGIITGVATGVYNVLAFDDSNPTVVAASLLGVSIIGEQPEITATTTPAVNTATTTTSTSTTTTTTTTPTITPTSPPPPCGFCDCSCGCTLCIVIIVVCAGVAVLSVLVCICVCCCLWKKSRDKKKINLISDDTSYNLSDNRSPPATLPSSNKDVSEMYSKPVKPAQSGTAPIVYAELSEIRGSQSSKNNTTAGGANPVVKDDTRVVYSDLLIKGQPPPPPYEPVELQSSVTVIPSAGKDPEIVEFFFNHKDSDDEDDTGGKGKYPPRPDERAPSPPDERAPSPPEEDQLPPPIPRKPYGQESEQGFTDESLHPELAEFRNNSDDTPQGHFMNTPTATYL